MSSQVQSAPSKAISVLAIASHVVYGYVGNKMVSTVLQTLGWSVSTMNTVNFSNHTGYKSVKGTKSNGKEISDLYEGLKQANLVDFGLLVSGYAPSAEVVEVVGRIGRELKARSRQEGETAFFWVLDPVMGDQGALYVSQDVVPMYMSIMQYADLILPNQFEAETLSGITISSPSDVVEAISALHLTYGVPNIIITSLALPSSTDTLSVYGSTISPTSRKPRIFTIDVPSIPVFFSGTGDMFAALTAYRLREAILERQLGHIPGWVPSDDVSSTELPLAKAVEKSLSSMHLVLERTFKTMGTAMSAFDQQDVGTDERQRYLKLTKESEVSVIEGVDDLKNYGGEVLFKAVNVES